MEYFTESLLKALENRQVQKRIREIQQSSQLISSSLECPEEMMQLEQTENLRQTLLKEKERADRLEKENELLKIELESVKQNIEDFKKIKNYHESKYGQIDAYYQTYLGLDSSIRSDLSTVLNDESPERFMFWGSQWHNIEALWQFIDISLSQNRFGQETVDILAKIFDYFFELYRNMTGNYERILTVEGETFDETIHKRSKDSRAAGKITRVFLCGYRGIYNKKTQKSVVRI